MAIVDGGEIKYFGVFNSTAQDILSRYLPIPTDDAGDHTEENAKPKTRAAKQATISKPEAKPVTKLPMGPSCWKYLNAGPGFRFVLAILLGMTSQSTRQMSDFWVRFWTSDKYSIYHNDVEYGNHASHTYAWVYGALVFAFFWFQIFRSSAFFWWSFGASNTVHSKKLHRVLNTPLGFFLVKPVGELLNTFASDQDKVDETLPDVLHFAVIYTLILLSTSVTVSINIPEFAAFAGVLVIVTLVMIYLYLPAATQIKAMRVETAGGLVGLTAEVLEGLPLIQAYSHEEHFVGEFTKMTDRNHTSLFNAESLNLWISFYCDFYGAVMLVAVCMFAVANKDRGSSVVGLAFSNTIQLLVFYTWTVRLITDAISLSAAVEQLTWLSYLTPIDGKDDINNEGKKLESAFSSSDCYCFLCLPSVALGVWTETMVDRVAYGSSYIPVHHHYCVCILYISYI